MSIEIKKPGFLTTIQDLGRYGSQKYGVIVGGAMDTLAVRIANMLVGNEEDEATIEVTMYGTELICNDNQLLAITGGDLEPMIGGKEVPMWRPIYMKKGQVLTFKSPQTGFYAYIALAGGINVPKVMGSRSTYIRGGIGGYKGRALQEGDVLSSKKISNKNKVILEHMHQLNQFCPWSVHYSSFYTFDKTQTIRILEGSEYDRFDKASQEALLEDMYTLTVQADRMGFQLEGIKLVLSETFELLSEGVTYGTIQVPSNGQPIILMADRQTTGGYPKIGQVISVDLPRLAQLQPGSNINFEMTTIDEAEELLMQREVDLYELKMGISFKV